MSLETITNLTDTIAIVWLLILGVIAVVWLIDKWAKWLDDWEH